MPKNADVTQWISDLAEARRALLKRQASDSWHKGSRRRDALRNVAADLEQAIKKDPFLAELGKIEHAFQDQTMSAGEVAQALRVLGFALG